MTDPAPQPEPSRHPSTTALATLLTLTLLAAVVLGWLWFTRYAPVHYDIGRNATLTDAEQARFIMPIILGGIALLALIWLIAWRLARWTVTTLPLAIAVIGAVALLAAIAGLWRAWNIDQEIAVITYQCDADAERMSPLSNGIPDGCEIISNSAPMTIGTQDDPDLLHPDGSSNSPSRFTDLPEGAYRAVLTAGGDPDTASIVLAAGTDDGIRALVPLRHQQGTNWSGDMPFHPDLDTYALLLYASPHQAAPDARVTFTVRACQGISPANFDATACQPAKITMPIVEVAPTVESATGRPVSFAIEDDTMTASNLEARSYTLTPTIELVMSTGTDGVLLIIPATDPQVRDSTALMPGETAFGSFTVEVDESSGELAYIVYIFPETQVLARSVPHAGVGP